MVYCPDCTRQTPPVNGLAVSVIVSAGLASSPVRVAVTPTRSGFERPNAQFATAPLLGIPQITPSNMHLYVPPSVVGGGRGVVPGASVCGNTPAPAVPESVPPLVLIAGCPQVVPTKDPSP